MMSAQPHDRNMHSPHNTQNTQSRRTTPRGLELAVFLLASVVGIYGIGKGFAGFYERGQEISLLWLAVTCFAFFVLFTQMGRVHDTWPHRPGKVPASVPASEESSQDESSDAHMQ